MDSIKDLIPGAIYFLDYGGNTQIIGRFESEDSMKYMLNDIVHYWNGFETFRCGSQPCIKSGLVSIRRATKPEKHTLIRFQIEHETI